MNVSDYESEGKSERFIRWRVSTILYAFLFAAGRQWIGSNHWTISNNWCDHNTSESTFRIFCNGSQYIQHHLQNKVLLSSGPYVIAGKSVSWDDRRSHEHASISSIMPQIEPSAVKASRHSTLSNMIPILVHYSSSPTIAMTLSSHALGSFGGKNAISRQSMIYHWVIESTAIQLWYIGERKLGW